MILFLLSSALSENEVSDKTRQLDTQVSFIFKDNLANVSTIGPQYGSTQTTEGLLTNKEHTTTTLDGPPEELDEHESTITDVYNGNGITSLNSSTELLHLLQQSTFFLNLAQQFLSRASNKTKIISQPSRESLLSTPSTEDTKTEKITYFSETSSFGPAYSEAITTQYPSPANMTTRSDDIETTTDIIIPTIRDKTVKENLDTKSSPSFSTLVLT